MLRGLLAGLRLCAVLGVCFVPLLGQFQPSPAIHTVFIITMENLRWSEVLGAAQAHYINDTLLPQASYATQYYGAPNIHPSLPNYLWLEAGTNFGLLDDNLPTTDHQATTQHLTTAMDRAGLSWAAWVENITGTTCPLTLSTDGLYTPAVNPNVYFDDVTGVNNPNSAYCIAHNHPFTSLAAALNNNTVANLNWVVPNLCDDAHSCPLSTGDAWLSNVIPMIQASQAYQQGGVIFVLWDEVDTPYTNVPVGMIVLSPAAKGGGYNNAINYTHASTVRTIEEIFGLTPWFADAATATDLSDLFHTAAVTVSPATLAFPPVAVGATSAAKTVTLDNNLPQALAVSGIAASGEFAQTNNCPAMLNAQSSCAIQVTFTPATTGAGSGELSVTDADPASPHVVALSGEGEGGVATLSASSLYFTPQSVGVTSAAQTLTITNTGGSELSFTGIAANGPFPEVTTCGSTLAPSASCTVRVSFDPTAPVWSTANLTIGDNAPNSPQVIALSGQGNGAIAVISTEALNFGNQTVGAGGKAQSFSIQNSGNVGLSFSSVRISGAFSQSNSCGAAVAAGASCSFQVTFSPSGPGTVSGSINFTDNAPDSPQEVNLSGNGQGAVAAFSPSSLNFAGQAVGSSSAAQALTLSNNGNLALTLGAIQLPAPFSQANNCGTTLATGATCVFHLVFSPTQPGPAAATLAVADNDPASPQNIPLTGAGNGATVTLTPASLKFPPQAVNTVSAAQSLTLGNGGDIALAPLAVAISGPFTQTNNCGASLAPAATCTVQVEFAPTAGSNAAGQLNLSDNAPASPQTVGLSGEGQAAVAVFSATTFSFSATSVGESSAPQALTVQNTGNAPLTLAPPVVSGPFFASDNCVAALAPQASCSIAITFSPSLPGAGAGSLSIADSAAANPQTIILNGEGEGAVAVVSSAPLSFAPQLTGTTAAPQTVTVGNSGNTPLTVSGASASGDFAAASGCAAAVAPGGSCVLTVTFTPTTTGTRAGTLTITDNAGVQSVALGGSGADLTLALGSAAPGGAASLTLGPGQSAQSALVLTSVDGFTDSQVALSCADLPALATCVIAPQAVGVAATTPGQANLTLTSGGSATAVAPNHTPLLWLGLWLGGGWLFLALPLWAATGRRRRRLIWVLGPALALAACGGSPPQAPPTLADGTYQVQLVATTSSGATRTLPLTLTVH